jgi:hypothetical protein
MKSYLSLLTGMIIGGIQHYYYLKMVWYAKLEDGFKPIAQVIDRRINRR